MVAATDMLPIARGMSVVVKNAGEKEQFKIVNVVMAVQLQVLLHTKNVIRKNTEHIILFVAQSNQENFLKFQLQSVKIAAYKLRSIIMKITQNLWRSIRFVKFVI